MGCTRGISHRMWTPEEKMQIVLLRLEQNVSTNELSERFGVNQSMIYRWCKEYTERGTGYLHSQNGTPVLPLATKTTKDWAMDNNKNLCMDADAFDKVTGNWIYYQRKKAGYSQLQLAKLMDFSQKHLVQVEAGNRNISLRGIMRLRSILNFTMSEYEAYVDNPGTEGI